MGGGKDGAKQKFVQEKYARHDVGKGDRLYCILTDKEPVRTFACRELTSQNRGKYEKLYDCRKPVKQYYIYFHDQLLGGPCYLKISSYLPFVCEFYFNGHNAIQVQLDKFLDCCADVDVSSISDQECDIFTKPVTDPAGRRIGAPDFRKDRQTALAKELLKPKYQVYGFKTAHLFKNLSGHFRNPAQIRYEMNKLKARGVLKKHDNQSFYGVTQKGFSWLWLQICSDNFFKNPMISRTIKNDALQLAAQPSQIEEAYDSIQRGLSKLTQQLAIIPCS